MIIARTVARVKGDFIRWWANNKSITIRDGQAAGLKFNMRNASADYLRGTNEFPVQKALARFLKPGDVFYDVGANIGFFTVIGARLVGPRGRIFAFEPVPENAEGVRRNAKLNNFHNITVFENAVSRSPGSADLLWTRHPGGSKLSTVRTPLNSVLKGVLTVNVICIDDLVALKTLLPPSVVKIDVEGGELGVLCGMSQTLGRFRPVVIYEVDHKDKQAFIQKDQELQDFLHTHGYDTMTLEESYPGIGWNVKHVIATPN